MPDAPPGDEEDHGWGPFDEKLDMGLEADNEAEGDKEPTEDAGDESPINLGEVKMLKEIIKFPIGDQPSTVPKSGNKWGSTHLNGGGGSSDSSVEDMDVSRGTWAKKKGATSTKALHPSQWSDEDIDIVHQIRYKTDLQCFQIFRLNKIAPGDIS